MNIQRLLPAIDDWLKQLHRLDIISPRADTQLSAALGSALAARLDSPASSLLTVLLLGPTGAGKSELLNALAGARIAQSHFLRPTTSRPTIYAHASVTPTELSEYGELLGEIARQPGAFITHEEDRLRHKVLIDAPDIDSFRIEHRETVLRLLCIVDVAVYVVTPFSYKDNIGWETVVAQRGRRAFAFVMNKWDEEGRPTDSGEEYTADVDFRKLLEASTGYDEPRIYRTSARYWIARRTGNTAESPPTGDQFEAFETWLSAGLASSHIAQIHARRRTSLWSELADALILATPPAADWNSWIAQVSAASDSLLYDGIRTMQPPLQNAAAEIAALRKEIRPRSFGLLGGILQTFSGGARLIRGKAPAPAVDPSVPPADTLTLGQRLNALLDLRVSALGWAAHQSNLQVAFLQKTWITSRSDLSSSMDQQFQLARDAALSRRQGRVRQLLSVVTMVLLEVLSVGLLGLTIWRIAKGFFTAHYADVAMLLSFILLFVVLLLAAWAVRVILFPTSPERIARELQKPLLAIWAHHCRNLLAQAREYTAQYSELVAKGAELQSGCRAAVEAARLKTADEDIIEDVERLFAKQNA